MKILGVIPSRYGSSRFPAKSLADIAGKSMVKRVYEQAIQSKLLNKVVVATDHQLIFDEVKSFSGDVYMTSEHHQSGTDRCREALMLQNENYDYVVNIQGDEPFIDPAQIDLLASLLDGRIQIATLIKLIKDEAQLFNPNIVKAIFDKNNEAIYFSRLPIPFVRSKEKAEWLQEHSYYKHIGIYAYRADTLEQITHLPVSSLEKAEALEQLRWLENGFRIKVAITEIENMGIDTPEDLEKALKTFNG